MDALAPARRRRLTSATFSSATAHSSGVLPSTLRRLTSSLTGCERDLAWALRGASSDMAAKSAQQIANPKSQIPNPKSRDEVRGRTLRFGVWDLGFGIWIFT